MLLKIIYSLIIFGILIGIHELGHFVAARIFKMNIKEFAIGMGPKIFSKIGKENEFGITTKYSLRALPIGGYVNLGEDEEVEEENGFNKKPIWQRIIVMASGAAMNFVLAIVIMIAVIFAQGLPVNTIDDTVKGKPAMEAGLQSGDKIVAIDGQTITSWEGTSKAILNSKNETLNMTIEREGKKITLEIPTVKDANGNKSIGIKPEFERQALKSVKYGFQTVGKMTLMMFDFIGNLFKGDVSKDDVSGPVGIVNVIGQAGQAGIINLFYLTALISVNLGIFNLLPIPALDGGRILFLAVQGITRKQIPPEKEGLIHFVGFVLLIGLIIFITFNDISKLL